MVTTGEERSEEKMRTAVRRIVFESYDLSFEIRAAALECPMNRRLSITKESVTMTSETNKDLVVQFWKAFEANDQDTLHDILAPDLVARTPGAEPFNREAHLRAVAMFSDGFSDRDFTVEELIAEGDKVATRITIRGTHTGDVHGYPPSGKQISATGLTMERIEGGKIVERCFSFDMASILKEIDVTMEHHAG